MFNRVANIIDANEGELVQRTRYGYVLESNYGATNVSMVNLIDVSLFVAARLPIFSQ